MKKVTLKEIFEELKNSGVDIGSNPHATFYFYKKKFHLPEPIGVKDKEALYPDTVIGLIKTIKKLQQEGMTLEQIQKQFNEMEKTQFINETFYRTGWHTDIEAKLRITEILNPDNILDETIDFCIGCRYKGYRHAYDCLVVSTVREGSTIAFFLIRIDHPETQKVVDSRNFSAIEFERFVGSLASQIMFSEKRNINPLDIFKAVFSDVTISEIQKIN